VEDVLQELRQHAEDTPVPLELPTEDDVLTVEEAILLPIPREYRAFLLQATNLVLGTLEPCTAADPSAHTYLPEVTAELWNRGLDRHLIPICVSRNAIYTIDPEGVISERANIEAAEGEKQWESIWEWALEVWLKSAN